MNNTAVGTEIKTSASWVLSTGAMEKLGSNVSKVQAEGARIIAGNSGMHYLLELLLKHSNPEVRVVTAEELFKVGSSAKVTLGQLLNDKDARVIDAANKSLRKLEETEMSRKPSETKLISGFDSTKSKLLYGFVPNGNGSKDKVKVVRV